MILSKEKQKNTVFNHTVYLPFPFIGGAIILKVGYLVQSLSYCKTGILYRGTGRIKVNIVSFVREMD